MLNVVESNVLERLAWAGPTKIRYDQEQTLLLSKIIGEINLAGGRTSVS